jgi:hypothetical protein
MAHGWAEYMKESVLEKRKKGVPERDDEKQKSFSLSLTLDLASKHSKTPAQEPPTRHRRGIESKDEKLCTHRSCRRRRNWVGATFLFSLQLMLLHLAASFSYREIKIGL